MNDFSIDIRRPEPAAADDPFGIRISVGNTVFTRLLRSEGNAFDDYLNAPPSQLAFWLADHWWRLRWETIPTTNRSPDWRSAHDLSSIGGGYPWPRLLIWGDKDRIGFLSQSDPVGVVGPVRYLTNALLYSEAHAFESEIDRFLDEAADERRGFGTDGPALRVLIAALCDERSDPDSSLWRRLEARLGFDPDQAPEELIESLARQACELGQDAVEEAVAATPGMDASTTLATEVEAARSLGVVCNFSEILQAVDAAPSPANEPPWVAAEKTAQKVREAANIDGGPLRNKALSDLLEADSKAFRTTAPQGSYAYGLRLSDERDNTQRIVLRSRAPQDRRFEMCRALGDALWMSGERMGPLARSATARQKFQRAFAQSLLCPFDDLRRYLKTDTPGENDITAAANYFHVSERVVQTVLVNKRVIEREQFEDMLEAA
jgi:hypothetical protein